MSKKEYTIKLSTIADVIQGQSPESEYYSELDGFPFLQGNRTFGNLYPFFDTYTKKITKVANKGDVLMSVRAPVGALNYAQCDLCIGRGLASIRAKDGNNQFIFYALKYNINNLIKQGSATTFDSVNKDIINDFELIIPENNKERQKVAKVLSDLDAKIELNDKINRELEAMAKLLYDYWFIQFDFPNEQGKPYKSSGGKMVYNSELKREIPEGWEVKTIGEWIKNDKSGDWGEETEKGNYQLKVSCVRGADLNGLSGKGELKPPTRFILENNSNKLLENHDLIVEISGGSPTQSTGRLAFIIEETLQRFPNPLICSNFCKALTLKEEKYLYNFVYQWNRIYDNGVLFGWEGKTSGIKNLLFDSFVTNHKEVYPNSEIVDKFYDFAKPLHSRKQKNLIQNQQLSELRDWLLPMLMNGQVTVQEAEVSLNMAAEPSVEYSIKLK